MELKTIDDTDARRKWVVWLIIGGLMIGAIVALLAVLPFLPGENDVDELINQGLVQYDSRDFEGARKTFEKVISLNPKKGMAYNYLGVMAQNSGHFEDAEAYFMKGVEVDPLTTANHHNLAGLYLQLDRLDDAEREFHAAMKLGPKAQYLLLHVAIAEKRKLDKAEVRRRLWRVVSAASGQAQALGSERLANDRPLKQTWVFAGRKLLKMDDTYGVLVAARLYTTAENVEVRRFARTVLSELGGMDALSKLLKSDKPKVRKTARDAMNRYKVETENPREE